MLVPMFNITYAQSIDDYVKEAVQNNPDIKSSFQNYYASLERINQAGTLPDPQLSFGYFISPVETRLGAQEAKIGFSQMFPWFGLLKNQKSIATTQAEIAFLEFTNKKNSIVFDTKKLFYKIYEVRKELSISRKNLEILKSFKDMAYKKYEAGKVTMVDVIRIQLEISELQEQISHLEDMTETMSKQFNLLLNKDVQTIINIPDDLDTLFVPYFIVRDSLINNPLYQKEIVSQQLVEKQQKEAKLKGYPDFAIGVDYGVISPRSDLNPENNGRDVLMPKISVSIPLYRKKYKSMSTELDFKNEAVLSKQDAIMNRLESDFLTSEINLKDAGRKLVLYEKELTDTHIALDILLSEYLSGEIEIFEILRIQQMLLRYEISYQKALTNMHTEYAKMNQLINR